jgi:hypothetical protein
MKPDSGLPHSFFEADPKVSFNYLHELTPLLLASSGKKKVQSGHRK